MQRPEQMLGRKFGKRTVLEEAGRDSNREILYRCQCECGRLDIIKGSALRAGRNKQCNSCAAKQTRNKLKHGLSKTSIYQSWKSMMHRCYHPHNPGYHTYGGRGISVCDEWKNPEKFYQWAISNGWQKGLSIDRINVNGNYEPSNCRWTDAKGQKENLQTIIRTNKSGFRGVSFRAERNVWLARITYEGKIIHLGHHASPELAAKAYDSYVIANGIKRPINHVQLPN